MVRLLLAYSLPLLAAGAMLLWQHRIDLGFADREQQLTWERKMDYLRRRSWRTTIASLILAATIIFIMSGLADLLARWR
jgi:hypothetical protein